MNIEIKQAVQKYLSEKNIRDIYIEMDNRGGCCSGPVYVPVVKLGKPDYMDMYDYFNKDEITIYVPKKMNNEEVKDITIRLRNILGHKSLIVDGLLAYKEKNWQRKKY